MNLGGDKEGSKVVIQLLGDCNVSISGQWLSGVPHDFYRLGAYILLESRSQPVLRRRIGEMIWSEGGPERAAADIRQAISRIRRFEAERDFRFIAADGYLVWCIKDPNVSCDLSDLLDALDLLDDGPSAAETMRICDVYSGVLLRSLRPAGEAFEEWLAFQQRALNDRFIAAVSAALLPGSPLSPHQMQYCARRLLKFDVCNEGAYCALMRVAARQGHLDLVKLIFSECRRTLRAELGIEPEGTTVRLFQALTNPAPDGAKLPA